MLNIHFANRFETLSDLLVRQIGESTGSVFSQDQVIVPSAAVRRRLTLELARQHGICANVGFGYLARWLWQQIGQLVPGVQAESPFDPAVLAWRVYSAFEDAAWLAPHRRLALYLERADPVMRFELATRTAGLFDQYITYRPDWLEAWLRGESVVTGTSQGSVASASADQSWQAALWRRLCAELGVTEGQHPAQAFQCALDASVHAVSGAGAASGAVSGTVSDTASGGPALTTSAHVFCLPTLPPLHLSLLQSLGRRIELHVYLLNPCREYWFEVIDRRRLAYLAARGKDQDLYHEQGHPLLASWGQQTQSQLALIVDASDETLIDDAHFSRNPDNSLLARLQNSILDMTPLAPGSVPVADHDRSIEIHVCHSLTREIEVLHDRLLALFAGPDAPALGDILVVTPDLDAPGAWPARGGIPSCPRWAGLP